MELARKEENQQGGEREREKKKSVSLSKEKKKKAFIFSVSTSALENKGGIEKRIQAKHEPRRHEAFLEYQFRV